MIGQRLLICAAAWVAFGTVAIASDLVVPVGCIVRGDCWDQTSSIAESAPFDREVEDVPDGLALQAGDYILLPRLSADAPELSAIETEALAAAAHFEWTPEQKAELEKWPGDVYGPPPADVADALIKALSAPETLLCYGAYSLLTGAVGTTPDAAGQRRMAAIYQTYLDHCFGPSPAAEDDIAKRLVLFASDHYMLKHQRIYCVGFIFRDDLVVTAKHCLVEPTLVEDFERDWGRYDTTHFITNIRLYPRTRAYTLAAAPFSFALAKPETTNLPSQLVYNPRLPSTDVVVLRLKDFPVRLSPFPVAQAKMWDAARVVGQFVRPQTLETVETEPGNFPNLVASELRTDGGPACRVFYAGEGCVFHMCQTFAGFSGSPFFTLNNGQPALAGIHAGATEIKQPLCEFKRATVYPNYAVDLTAVPGWDSPR
jgi:hypothetical protein